MPLKTALDYCVDAAVVIGAFFVRNAVILVVLASWWLIALMR